MTKKTFYRVLFESASAMKYFYPFSTSVVKILQKLQTTIPIACFSPVFVSSTVSSITRFMNGSNPLRMPLILRPPFSFTVQNGRKMQITSKQVNKEKLFY